jgi:hypothetical protein
MSRNTREIAWIRAARKKFEKFPIPAQRIMARAAEDSKADIAKPMKGWAPGFLKSRRPTDQMHIARYIQFSSMRLSGLSMLSRRNRPQVSRHLRRTLN